MITFTLNGKQVSTKAESDTPLLWVIRDEYGLTGAKFGCGIAMCGACTVHMNGAPVRSCSVTVGAAKNSEVTTIEGLHAAGEHPASVGLDHGTGTAMRLLPVRTDHAGSRPAEQ